MPVGSKPTPIVAVTLFVLLLMRETVCELRFATQTESESTAILNGVAPTPIFAVTLFVLLLMRETVFEPPFATHTDSESTPMPRGVAPTPIVAVILFVLLLMRETVFELMFATQTESSTACALAKNGKKYDTIAKEITNPNKGFSFLTSSTPVTINIFSIPHLFSKSKLIEQF